MWQSILVVGMALSGGVVAPILVRITQTIQPKPSGIFARIFHTTFKLHALLTFTAIQAMATS